MSNRSAVKLADVARHLGVSEATVSRVLNGKGVGFISERTRSRVLLAAKEMGYTPNRLAKGLATGQTGVCAMWIRNPDAPNYARVLRRLHDHASADGISLVLHALHHTRQGAVGVNDSGQATSGPGWPADAIIGVDCPRLLAHLRQENPRAHCFSLGHEPLPEVDSVTLESEAPFASAAQHLISRGRRNIILLTAECSIPSVREGCERAFTSTVRGAGLEARIVVCPNETRQGARETVANLLNSGARVDAFLCINDDVALGAYRALRDAGRRVPEDVAIVGCDDIPDAMFIDVPLTTIRQPVEELCDEAWRLLKARRADPDAPPVHSRLTPSLVVRASS